MQQIKDPYVRAMKKIEQKNEKKKTTTETKNLENSKK